MDIEICIESVAEAKMAAKHGAKRVELCSGLDVGGLTPSLGLISECAALEELEVHVLLRPRSGNFEYTEDELQVMEKDIRMARKYGAKGVVFGVLIDGMVNIDANRRLQDLAELLELETTFHRAFDIVKDPLLAFKKIIGLGFDRILTSGQQRTAIQGVGLITELVEVSNKKIQIMAGSGVGASNAKQLAEVGIDAIHFSSRKEGAEETLGMGSTYQPDPSKIEAVLGALRTN